VKFIEAVPIVNNENISGDYHRLTFSFAPLAEAAAPGQFVTVTVPGPNAPLLRRPFSIHRVLPDGHVQILFKIVGEGTLLLSQSKRGELLDVLGPLGDGVFRPVEKRPHILLVAGGIGIAPLLFLADRLLADKQYSPLLLFGGRSQVDLPARESFAELDIETQLITEDGSRGRQGLVTDLLDESLAKDTPACQVMACGPTPMLQAVADRCAQSGTPCQVSLETVMACGAGSCYGCVVEVCDDCADKNAPVAYERVCHEGPVFDAARLTWGKS